MEIDAFSPGNSSRLLPIPEPLELLHTSIGPPSPSEYPNVFDESKDMLLSAILIYGVIDLRTLAKQGLLVDANTGSSDCYLLQQLLQLPISAKDVVRLVARHRKQIEEHIGRDSTELYLDAFDAIQSSSSSRELELEFRRGQVSLVDFTVCAVQDDNIETELVYAICVDTARRRITVIFRGCSTRKDWTICATNILKEQLNPLFRLDLENQQPEYIAIHSGYCDYLFNANNQASGVSKFEELATRLEALQQEYPGYRIYVTGHSLGAALATVFSFQAAATGRPKQQQDAISVINFASPMVGNLAFETAFRQLEAEGKIRCLRITNHFDIFTQLPDRGNWLYVVACAAGFHLIAYVAWSLLFFLCFQNNVYRHVGMDLHIYKQRQIPAWLKWNKVAPQKQQQQQQQQQQPKYSYKVKHSRGTPDSFAWRVALDWKKHFKQAVQRLVMVPFVVDFNTNHSVEEHLHRLTGLAGELEGVYLQDLYNRKTPTMSSPTSVTSPLAGVTNCCAADTLSDTW
ncbi:Phospholipase A1 [Seminavis robusta]|uniref:Phospholipase A1 n=1 Tax=Seminavis robusta TaxID=568900 RepID=A0A9N8E4B5_9STRA|nr:Phospholipase A1 [Seminavis robusta]|eukprot:Sro605_g174320.1 Phospholipase A1 (515) ;mRNA; f:33316-34860